MSDASIKTRIRRSKKSAAEHFVKAGYMIIETAGEPFTFIAVREKELRFIRVVLDRIQDSDIQALRPFRLPDCCTREVVRCRGREIEIREVR